MPGSEEKILEILRWLGINWDEGPYRQSERLKLYQEYAQELVKQGAAYADEGAIRLRVPKGRTLTWQDLIQGPISFQSDALNDPVLLKSDGFPTYHLAVVVDDHLMKITHILRAAEWISSTPKHVLIYEALGWPLPEIGHFSVILGPDKAKLSKRHGAKSILDYRDEGYLAEALLTFMAYLGWSDQDNSQILTLKELIDKFDLKAVHKANPIFDQKKLDYFNAQLIRRLPSEELLGRLKPFIPADCKRAEEILPLVKERLVKLSEFEGLTEFFYREIKPDPGVLVKDQLEAGKHIIESVKEWRAETLEEKFRQVATEKNWQPGQFFMMLRVAVTGKTVTPPLFETMEVLGRQVTLTRLAHAKKYCP